MTQQELADQTGLAVKTVQDIEAGRINPTYETLELLINRLGISPNLLFQHQTEVDEETLHFFLGLFQSCSTENQEILVDSVIFLAERLLRRQKSDTQQKNSQEDYLSSKLAMP